MIKTEEYIKFLEKLKNANSPLVIENCDQIIKRLQMWEDFEDELSRLFLSGGVVSVESLYKSFKKIKEKYFPAKKINIEVECDEEDAELFEKYLKKYSDSLPLHDIKFKIKKEDKKDGF